MYKMQKLSEVVKTLTVKVVYEEEYYDDLGKLFSKLIPLSWVPVFKSSLDEIEHAGSVLTRLIKETNCVICPKPMNVFRAFTMCPEFLVKVVIIGQDPYPHVEDSQPLATGCCFETFEGVPIQRSLSNIMRVLKSTVKYWTFPENGDLTKWCNQGVLLLNKTPTVFKDDPNCHENIWDFFLEDVLKYLTLKRSGIVYMLWGKKARSLIESVPIPASKNCILEASHPAARGKSNTFRDCNHFNECNDYLYSIGRTPINWSL